MTDFTNYDFIQGKCARCKIAYRWKKKGARIKRLKDAYCPRCGSKLWQTTHQLKWYWDEKTEPVGAIRARELERGARP